MWIVQHYNLHPVAVSAEDGEGWAGGGPEAPGQVSSALEELWIPLAVIFF